MGTSHSNNYIETGQTYYIISPISFSGSITQYTTLVCYPRDTVLQFSADNIGHLFPYTLKLQCYTNIYNSSEEKVTR